MHLLTSLIETFQKWPNDIEIEGGNSDECTAVGEKKTKAKIIMFYKSFLFNISVDVLGACLCYSVTHLYLVFSFSFFHLVFSKRLMCSGIFPILLGSFSVHLVFSLTHSLYMWRSFGK
jgi:hypothetical protein